MRLGKIRKIHFVGIGGIGMSGIAEVLLNQGYEVSGSDRMLSDITRHLESLGAKIYEAHSPEHVVGADVLVYSSAVTPENVEVREAIRQKIPVIKRAEMLAELMRLKYGIAISGTHGKTTTTSMTGAVLTEGGLDPTLIIGGKVRSLKTNAKLGKSEFLVAEADEYDRSFLKLTPTIAVVTNIDTDHMDCYQDYEDLKQSFLTFVNKVPFYGKVVVCLDNPGVQEILTKIERRVETYGFIRQADLTATDIEFGPGYVDFVAVYLGQRLGKIRLKVPGKHNVQNALASISVGLELDIPFARIKKALENFSGVDRRFEIKAVVNDVMVVNDYAHHPTEIQASLEGARQSWPERRIIAIFQPHLYSRTRDFYKEFARSFFNADIIIVTEIYPAREEPIPGISGQLIADTARELGHKQVYFEPDMNKIPQLVSKIVASGDMVVTIGAGSIWKVDAPIIEILKEKEKLASGKMKSDEN